MSGIKKPRGVPPPLGLKPIKVFSSVLFVVQTPRAGHIAAANQHANLASFVLIVVKGTKK